MALELRISGPGLDFTRRMHPGEPALILGRDADCSVCLADPDRNVSRRHLSVWNDRDELQFHVLSIVNGVDVIPGGEVAPGGRGVLHVGEALILSAYRVTVSLVSGDASADPWALLEQEAALSTLQGLPAGQDTVPASLDDDPFGDWGFESTFGPGSPGGGALDADGLAEATDLKPFIHGLGLDPAKNSALTQGELEVMGRLTRIALVGLVQAVQAINATKQALHAEDRTMYGGGREGNPLRLDAPIDSKLQYLFGGRATAAGFTSPDRAVSELVSDIMAHQEALGNAMRDAVKGVVSDFDPEMLKSRLLGTGSRLFESARAWDAFVRDYNDHRVDMEEWVQQLLDRHFVDAYLREFVRARRETSSKRR